MEHGTVLYLSRKDVETINLPMRKIIGALDEMFKEKGAGRTEMPLKPGRESDEERTLSMHLGLALRVTVEAVKRGPRVHKNNHVSLYLMRLY
jgi:ornithine cyclodeaminase/alanine dehydrogenase-like protein (mu-crystallin family)